VIVKWPGEVDPERLTGARGGGDVQVFCLDVLGGVSEQPGFSQPGPAAAVAAPVIVRDACENRRQNGITGDDVS